MAQSNRCSATRAIPPFQFVMDRSPDMEQLMRASLCCMTGGQDHSRHLTMVGAAWLQHDCQDCESIHPSEAVTLFRPSLGQHTARVDCRSRQRRSSYPRDDRGFWLLQTSFQHDSAAYSYTHLRSHSAENLTDKSGVTAGQISLEGDHSAMLL